MKVVHRGNIECYLRQRVSVKELLDSKNDLSSISTPDAQQDILSILLSLVDLNGFYVKSFLTRYLELLENSNVEVNDELYELITSKRVLNSKKNVSETDVITYSIDGFKKNKPTSKSDTVIVKESPRVISGLSTTGLRTWEGSLYLANFLNDKHIDLNDTSVLELGGGTGVVSLALTKYFSSHICKLKYVILTDGSRETLEKFQDTLKLNQISADASSTPLSTSVLVWGTDIKELRADYLVGADITYDDEAFKSLCHTIASFFSKGTRAAFIAATNRNEMTLNKWDEQLNQSFNDRWEIINSEPRPHSIECNTWFSAGTPEIRIYRINNT